MGKWLLVGICFVAGCCGSAAPTMPCVDPAAGVSVSDGGGVRVESPALDCPSKLCLVSDRDGGATALCTVECSSDHDCAVMGTDYCRSGYACGAVAGYPRAVCTCRDQTMRQSRNLR